MNIVSAQKITLTELREGHIRDCGKNESTLARKLIRRAGYMPALNTEQVTTIEWPNTVYDNQSGVAVITTNGLIFQLQIEGDHDRFDIFGKYFGFPECCIQEFINRTESLGDEPFPLRGTGFVPCQCCRKKTEDELVKIINANRYCPAPFPYGEDASNLFLYDFYQNEYQP